MSPRMYHDLSDVAASWVELAGESDDEMSRAEALERAERALDMLLCDRLAQLCEVAR